MDKGLKLSNSEEVINHYVDAYPGSGHVKDQCTKKYLYTNEVNLVVFGMNNVKDMIGLTVQDLNGFMRPYWGKQFAKTIDNHDDVVVYEKKTITDYHKICLDPAGRLYIHDITKTPLLGKSDKVVSILTTSYNVTNKLSYDELFERYLAAYRVKHDACFHFIQHFGLEKYFANVPTPREINVLLAMVENSAYKYVAKKLFVNCRTVETHVINLMNKLSSTTLPELLVILRKLK